MITVTVKNFRFFSIKPTDDLYELVDSKNQLIHVSNDQGIGFVYSGYNNKVLTSEYNETPYEFIEHIADNLDVNSDLITGLIECANDGDEDGLYYYLDKNGGELAWFDLLENPIEEETITSNVGNIVVLFSQGELDVDNFTEDGVSFNGGILTYPELFGKYDEEVELVIIYSE
jgi:hypothetical protein